MISRDIDWSAYVRGTHNKYVMYYQVYAENHNQHTATDYDALEKELSNLLAAIEQATTSGAWSSIISMASDKSTAGSMILSL